MKIYIKLFKSPILDKRRFSLSDIAVKIAQCFIEKNIKVCLFPWEVS